ncbi:cytochrome p450 81d11 [Phtheirospermum japonicum]|uniref:Cytochrome p450 81d11 n=1 Tax=Phtheirospermum japonicum TaxID=374723 RepID=A0A830D7D5_9LAMI|nr:cytochrome p450 81d11 [Phtheirospermum japonicum]
MEHLSYCYLVLLIVIFIILKKRHSSQKLNSPPSPPSLPLIGHLHLIKNALHISLSSLSSQYGPIFSLHLGCKSFVVISSPSAVEECFTKNDVVFANRPRTMAGDRLTYNYAAYVWSPYGHFWRTLRKLTVIELFSSHSLARSAVTREEETRKIIRVLKNNRAQRVDLNYLASVYSFNHMMRGVAGRSCVEEEEIEGEIGREKLERGRGLFSVNLSLGMCDFFPVLRWIGYKGMEKSLMSLHKKRDEFSQNLIDEVKLKNDDAKSSLIQTLLSLQESEPEFYTDDVIKSMILILFIAGTETTAVTIEWAMSLLLTHPDELHKLRQEIDDNIGHDHLLSDSDLTKLPYLRCVVNETLRLYPPVPLLLPRYSSENCTVGGYNVPKGTILLVNAWAMLRNPKLWDEPNKFNPGRFMDMEMEREGYKFVPFGMGRRACPGSTMGMRTVSLALGTFVQCFEWEKVLGHEEMENKYKHLMLKKVNPLEAVCVPRHQAADILSQL